MRSLGMGMLLVLVLGACPSPPVSEGEGEGEGVCRGLTIRCGAVCVDVTQDDDHCGVCGNACGLDERCAGARCNASCPEPVLDVEGTLVGTFPDLASSRPAHYDVDGDGVVDDVCGGFRLTTDPVFSVAATGQPNPILENADLMPNAGLERLSGCRVENGSGQALATFSPPCAPAGNGFSDVDDDGDFDLVFSDGRVFLQSATGLSAGDSFVPPPPGAVARFRIDTPNGASDFVSWDRSTNEMERLLDGAWEPVGSFNFGEVAALYPLIDGPDRTLLVWLGVRIVPNLAICSFDNDSPDFRCRQSAMNAGIVTSPPRDGRILHNGPGVIGASGAERSMGAPLFSSQEPPFFAPTSVPVALSQTAAWLLTVATDEVHRHPLTPTMMMPLSGRAVVAGEVVDVRTEGGSLTVGERSRPIPASGSPVDMVLHPQRPIAWLALQPHMTRQDEGVVLGVDLADGGLVATLEVDVPFLFPNGASRLQIVDLDGDGALELVAGTRPTRIFDAETGALEQELVGLVRFVESVDGALVPGSLPGSLGIVDLDGDGAVDELTSEGSFTGAVAGDGWSFALGGIQLVVQGPGRHEFTVFTESRGAATWPLRCQP